MYLKLTPLSDGMLLTDEPLDASPVEVAARTAAAMGLAEAPVELVRLLQARPVTAGGLGTR
ncbi:MAG: hypothetical protein U0Y82_16255 [Thermoleophilia bacterium]